MADEETKKEEGKEKEGKKRDLLKLIMLVSQVITLLLVIGMFIYFKFFFSVPTTTVSPEMPSTEVKEKKEKAEAQSSKKQVIAKLEPFVVNLLDNDGRRFLKVTINLVVESDEVSKEIEERLAEVRDLIIICLSDKSFNEISDQTGKMRLRKEIKRQLNELLTSGDVIKVLFTEFVVQ